SPPPWRLRPPAVSLWRVRCPTLLPSPARPCLQPDPWLPSPNVLEPRLEAEQPRHKQGGDPMARTLEFYFDYGSPYSYLADTQVEAIAKRAGATLVRKPMLLGGVFKSTGNASPMTVE